jgi:hypothetical protein
VSVHEIETTGAPTLENVLLWDVLEGEWRIGHARLMIDGLPAFYCAVSVAEAHDLIADDYPVPVFEEVSHWARLPDQPGVPA